MLRNVEDTLTKRIDGIILDTVEIILKTSTKKALKGIFSRIYEAAEEVSKQVISRSTADKNMDSRLDRLTEPQKIAQNIVSRLMKTPSFTAPFTKQVKWYI